MKQQRETQKRKIRRAKRTRAKLLGTAKRPRLAVFRSNRFISAQLIDDSKHKTLASATSRGMAGKKIAKKDQAAQVGELIAKKAVELGVKEAVFDRRSYQYHGRVAAVAEGARKGGLKI